MCLKYFASLVYLSILLLLLSGIYNILRVWTASFWRFRYHTQGHTTVGRNPPDGWSARRRDLYLTTHTTLTTDNLPCPRGIRTRNSSKRSAVDTRLRPLGHWDRLYFSIHTSKRHISCHHGLFFSSFLPFTFLILVISCSPHLDVET